MVFVPCFVAAKENMQHALSEEVDYTTEAHLRTHWRLLTYVTKVRVGMVGEHFH